MGFDSVIRAGLKVADQLTKSLQASITHQAWEGDDDGFGLESFADSATTLKAIVEPMHKMVYVSGRMVAVKAKVTILEEIIPNGAAGRLEPIDHRDKITLPDGTTGPIVDIKGVTDPTTNRPYFAEVLLGDPTSSSVTGP